MYNKLSICAEELIILDGIFLRSLKLAIPEDVTNPSADICCDPDNTSLLNPRSSICWDPDIASLINPKELTCSDDDTMLLASTFL